MGARTNGLLLTKKMEVGKKKKKENWKGKNSDFIVEKLDRHHSNHGVKINPQYHVKPLSNSSPNS